MKKVKVSDYLGKHVNLKIDRPLGSKHPKYNFIYPLNYGDVSKTIEMMEKNQMCIYQEFFEVVDEYKQGKVLSYIHRINDNADKLIVVSDNCNYMNNQIRALIEFQERFFKSGIYN